MGQRVFRGDEIFQRMRVAQPETRSLQEKTVRSK